MTNGNFDVTIAEFQPTNDDFHKTDVDLQSTDDVRYVTYAVSRLTYAVRQVTDDVRQVTDAVCQLDFVETHGKVSVRQGVSADSQLANHERFGLAYWLRVGPALFAKFCFPF